MKKIKKPNLTKALENLKNDDECKYGNLSLDFDLPDLIPKKERITINLDQNIIDFFKNAAKRRGDKYQTLINDTLQLVVMKNSNKKKHS